MDRKQKISCVMSVAIVFCAVAFVTARPVQPETPLYTFRMEQQCSEMNFLPTPVNGFTFAAERGYTLEYAVAGGLCGVTPLDTGVWTCYYSTCGGETCYLTCPESCYGTCNDPTCPVTCDDPTCVYTCNQHTCDPTCFDWTCVHSTCEPGQMC